MTRDQIHDQDARDLAIEQADRDRDFSGRNTDSAETDTVQGQAKITTGTQGAGFWAKYGNIYEGGYLSERQAINAVKRRLKKHQQI